MDLRPNLVSFWGRTNRIEEKRRGEEEEEEEKEKKKRREGDKKKKRKRKRRRREEKKKGKEKRYGTMTISMDTFFRLWVVRNLTLE